MSLVPPRLHGVIDYLAVLALLAAPAALGLSGGPRAVSYTVAAAHLLLTALTAFPLGLRKTIPFSIHGAAELAVGLALMAVPWLAGFEAEVPARGFCLLAGAALAILWLLTDYRAAEPTGWA